MSWIDRRAEIIEKIRATLQKAKKKGLAVDDTKIRGQICAQYGCSWRTSLDYLRTARATR